MSSRIQDGHSDECPSRIDEHTTKSVDGAMTLSTQMKTFGPSHLAAAFLRLALGAGFLSAVADRLGFLGPPGAAMVSWGNFHNFLLYTARLNPWCPAACLPLLGVVVTVAEAGLGILLILGIFTRVAGLLTGMITLAFAAAMTFVLGVHGPLIYSVFVFSAASFLLASQTPDNLSIDNFRDSKKLT
jgi:putative oxidoreductase